MELAQYKKTVKALGYKIRVSKYSEFYGVSYSLDGLKVPTGVMTQADCEKHKELHALRIALKGQVFDGFYRVSI